MIPLTNLDKVQPCPKCGTTVSAADWLLPGFLAVADYTCSNCGTRFYSELPVGQTVNQHHTFIPETGEVLGPSSAFAEWFRNRIDDDVTFDVQVKQPARDVIFLNCIDFLYGHALLKLLNAQAHLDKHPDLGLVVLVQPFLEWLVPDGVSEVWVTDLGLADNRAWHDGVGRAIREQLDRFDSVRLSPTFAHPQPEDVAIERFSRVKPFSETKWGSPPAQPTVTFVWREDRPWLPPAWQSRPRRAVPRLIRGAPDHLTHAQVTQVVELAEQLRREFAELTFNVVGIGSGLDVPDWISSSITRGPTQEVEREWCEIYAQSHVAVGIHGSNMLLPSAHAGGVVELVPDDRWGNIVQDLITSRTHVREALFTYRNVPASTSPQECAAIITALLREHDGALAQLGPHAARHD